MIHKRRHGNTQLHSTMHAEQIGEAPAGRTNYDIEIEQEQKKTYMDFIYRLMARMDIKSLERMLDAAIDEIK